ncbi:hypothetical protein V6N13_109605 [Hibiscus sabdariffa]
MVHEVTGDEKFKLKMRTIPSQIPGLKGLGGDAKTPDAPRAVVLDQLIGYLRSYFLYVQQRDMYMSDLFKKLLPTSALKFPPFLAHF